MGSLAPRESVQGEGVRETTHIKGPKPLSLLSSWEAASTDSVSAHALANRAGTGGDAAPSATPTPSFSVDEHTPHLRNTGVEPPRQTRAAMTHRGSLAVMLPSSESLYRGEGGKLHCTPQAEQPLPPPHFATQTTTSSFTWLSTTAAREGGGRAAGYRGSSPTAVHLHIASMSTPTPKKNAVRPQRAPDLRDSSSPNQSQGRRLGNQPQKQLGFAHGTVEGDMPSELFVKRVCSRRGSVPTDVLGIPCSALVPDEGRRKYVSGSSGRDITLTVASSPSPGAVAKGASEGTGNAMNVDGVSASRAFRVGLATSAPHARVAPGSAAASVTQPRMLSSYLMTKPKAVTSPLVPQRQDPSALRSKPSRRQTNLSQMDLCASPSTASITSMEESSPSQHSFQGKPTSLSYTTDRGVVNSMRSMSNRRVHFMFDRQAGDGLTAADSPTVSLHSSDDIRLPQMHCPVTSVTLSPVPSDSSPGPASPVSRTDGKFSNNTRWESVQGKQQLRICSPVTATRSVSSTQPPHFSEASSFQGSGSSVLSLRLNKKDGCVEAVPIFAQAKYLRGSSSTSSKSAAESVGPSFYSALSAAPTTTTLACSFMSTSSLDPPGGATYQPRHPLPKPALRQISRYSESGGAARSYAGATRLKEGSDSKSWWHSIESMNTGTMATASPSRSSSKSVGGWGFTSYMRGALISRQQRRASDAGAPYATSGGGADAGRASAATTTLLSSPVRAAGSRGRRKESLLKWSLLGVVALTSVFLILVSTMMD